MSAFEETFRIGEVSLTRSDLQNAFTKEQIAELTDDDLKQIIAQIALELRPFNAQELPAMRTSVTRRVLREKERVRQAAGVQSSFLMTVTYSSYDNEQGEPEWAVAAFYVLAETDRVATQKTFAFIKQQEEFRKAQARGHLYLKVFPIVPQGDVTPITVNITL